MPSHSLTASFNFVHVYTTLHVCTRRSAVRWPQIYARRLDMQNNKYKKLPAGIGWLGSLERMNLRHNLFKSLPRTICNLTNMEFFDASENQLRSLPGNLHKVEALVEVRATHNKIRSPPGKLGTAPNIQQVSNHVL